MTVMKTLKMTKEAKEALRMYKNKRSIEEKRDLTFSEAILDAVNKEKGE